MLHPGDKPGADDVPPTPAAPAPDAPWRALRLTWGDGSVQVLISDPRVAGALRSYYGAALAEDPGSPADAVVRLVHGPVPLDAVFEEAGWAAGAVHESPGGRHVLDRDSGVLADLRPGDATVRGDLQRHLARAVAVLNSVYAEAMRRRGYLLFHGAAVARAGRAVLILGPSRVGKSSTVLRLLDRGYQFLADDNLLARPAGDGIRVVGFPRWPRVFPDTLLRQPRLATLLEPAERAALVASSGAPVWREKRAIDLVTVYGPECRVTEATLAAVMRLDWRSGGGATVVRRRGRIAALAHAACFDPCLGTLDLSRPALRRPPRLLRGLYRIPRAARYMRLLAPVPLLSVTGSIDHDTLDSTIESLLPTS